MFFEAVENRRFGTVNPVVYGFEDCKSGHSYGPAVREYYLIHYCISGCGIYKIGGKTYSVGEGEMFIIPPGALTYYEADADTPWSYIWIGFTADILPVELPPKAALPEGKAIFESIKNIRGAGGGKCAMLISKIWELLSYLCADEQVSVSTVMKAKSVFSSLFSSPITVSDVADMLHVERTHFSFAFKKEMGISPKEYLTSLRMQKAKELLKTGSCNITAVANSVGYNDLYTFSKAYKRYFGVCPKSRNNR